MLRRIVGFLTLFSSLSTLVCCALPALLVTLGLGASLASFLGNYPGLIWLSEHKTAVFGFAGAMLIVTAIMRYYSSSLSCPIEPKAAEACKRARRFSTGVFYSSLIIYLIGASFAFIL